MARRRRRRKGSLKDLIEVDLLQVGEELRCEPPSRIGGVHKAYLKDDGSVEENGNVLSLAKWSNAVKGRSSNAWISVTARGQLLDSFRKQFEDGIEPSQEIQPAIVKPELVQDAPQNDTRPADAGSLQSEVNTLKSQLASQQSALASLNAKIDNLSVGASEKDTGGDIIRNLRERVLKLEPDEFEQLVGEYLKAKGFSNVVVSGRSHDGGIDGECELPLIDVKVAFQAKRYADGNNIGIDPVQRLNGSLGSSSYDRGVFITTSEFTSFARGWVEEEQVKIALIDGDEFVVQMIDMGLGVKTIPVVKQEVDESFFADLEN